MFFVERAGWELRQKCREGESVNKKSKDRGRVRVCGGNFYIESYLHEKCICEKASEWRFKEMVWVLIVECDQIFFFFFKVLAMLRVSGKLLNVLWQKIMLLGNFLLFKMAKGFYVI